MPMRSLLRMLPIALSLAVSPLFARKAEAQATIRVGATVTPPIGMVRLEAPADSTRPVMEGAQRVQVRDVGRVQVLTGEGAVLRAATSQRDVRITIDYVGS